MCLAADEEPSRSRGGLKPRRGVHDVAGSQHVRARGIDGNHGVAGVHGGARDEVERLLAVQLLDPFEHTKTRANRALCVLAVRYRGPKTAITASPMNFSTTPPWCSIRRLAFA